MYLKIKDGAEYIANQKKYNYYYQFRTGLDVSEYIGQYYNCIFDEENGQFDLSKPHQHKILDAFNILRPNHIYHGLAIKLREIGFSFKGEFIRAWLYGVDSKYITGVKK